MSTPTPFEDIWKTLQETGRLLKEQSQECPTCTATNAEHVGQRCAFARPTCYLKFGRFSIQT